MYSEKRKISTENTELSTSSKALRYKGNDRIPLERKELRSEPRTEDKHGDQTDSVLTENTESGGSTAELG